MTSNERAWAMARETAQRHGTSVDTHLAEAIEDEIDACVSANVATERETWRVAVQALVNAMPKCEYGPGVYSDVVELCIKPATRSSRGLLGEYTWCDEHAHEIDRELSYATALRVLISMLDSP